MCAISGFNWKDSKLIADMVAAQTHRGPDADGVFVDDHISLGNNRLAVIDLSAEANQPMKDRDGELVIVYNGEIYNFRQLQKELEGKYAFTTKSDTEVILAGYRVWGAGVVSRLNGMFAFAIWDKRTSTLFCARDHAGMKPFYYFWDGSRFIFASEIPAILCHPVERRLNREAFSHYLRVLYTPEPMTMIENIYKLPPAHTLTLRGEKMTIEAYSPVSSVQPGASYEEMRASVKETVMRAVERHLLADVPVGVYLSGGIDSSTVLCAMSKLRGDIKTFSVGFELGEGEESTKFNSDFDLARRTADFFGAKHHPLRISPSDVLATFDSVVSHNSDPISNPTSFAMMMLARFARKEVTVALTGNAGDELFGGYDRYRFALAAQWYHKLPVELRSIFSKHPRLSKLEYQDGVDLFARFMFQKDNKLSRVIAEASFEPGDTTKKFFKGHYFENVSVDLAEALMEVDRASWLPDYFFMLSDKMSMAASLEERMPLADVELIALARSIPRRYKVGAFETKRIFKDAFRNELPPFLFNQPKRGWFSPAAKWLRNKAFADFAREVLSPSYYEGTESLFAWGALTDMLERHIDKREYNLTLLWSIITFQAWARHFKVTL